MYPEGIRTYEMQNNLTIRMSFKLVLFLQSLSQCAMIVDLSVNGKDKGGILVGDGLCPGIYCPELERWHKCVYRRRQSQVVHDRV